MSAPVPLPLSQRPAWTVLTGHVEQVRGTYLRELFDADPERGTRLTAEAVGIFLDYSKNRVTDETLSLLLELAEQSLLRERIDAMFTGEKIRHHGGPCGAARRAPRPSR